MKLNLLIIATIVMAAPFAEAKMVNGQHVEAPASKRECAQIELDATTAYRPFDDAAFEALARYQDIYVKRGCGTVEKLNKRITRITNAQDRKYGKPAPPRGSTLITDDLPDQDFIDENISTSSSSVPMGEGQFYAPADDRNTSTTPAKPAKVQKETRVRNSAQ